MATELTIVLNPPDFAGRMHSSATMSVGSA
jgi:hypothetical protein